METYTYIYNINFIMRFTSKWTIFFSFNTKYFGFILQNYVKMGYSKAIPKQTFYSVSISRSIVMGTSTYKFSCKIIENGKTVLILVFEKYFQRYAMHIAYKCLLNLIPWCVDFVNYYEVHYATESIIH